MTLTLYMSQRFENTIMEYGIGTVLGVSVHLPCLVVYLNANQIKISCKLSPIKVVGDSCQKITLLLLKRKSVRVIVPESCF